MWLDKKGKKNWSYATRASIMKKLAFVLDNTLLQVVTVQSQITEGVAVLSLSDISRQEMEEFKAIIERDK